MPYEVENPAAGAADGGLGGGKIGATGTPDFYIKLKRNRGRMGSPLKSIFGAGDSYPKFQNNGLLYGYDTFYGFMVPSHALGLANIVDNAKNPIANVTLDSNTIRHTKTIYIEWVDYDIDFEAGIASVAFITRVHNTNPVDIESVP